MTGANSGECRQLRNHLTVLRAGRLSQLSGEVWEMMTSRGSLKSLVVFLSTWVGSLVGIKALRGLWPWQELHWNFKTQKSGFIKKLETSLNSSKDINSLIVFMFEILSLIFVGFHQYRNLCYFIGIIYFTSFATLFSTLLYLFPIAHNLLLSVCECSTVQNIATRKPHSQRGFLFPES